MRTAAMTIVFRELGSAKIIDAVESMQDMKCLVVLVSYSKARIREESNGSSGRACREYY